MFCAVLRAGELPGSTCEDECMEGIARNGALSEYINMYEYYSHGAMKEKNMGLV